jgi:hypothetical protein
MISYLEKDGARNKLGYRPAPRGSDTERFLKETQEGDDYSANLAIAIHLIIRRG